MKKGEWYIDHDPNGHDEVRWFMIYLKSKHDKDYWIVDQYTYSTELELEKDETFAHEGLILQQSIPISHSEAIGKLQEIDEGDKWEAGITQTVQEYIRLIERSKSYKSMDDYGKEKFDQLRTYIENRTSL